MCLGKWEFIILCTIIGGTPATRLQNSGCQVPPHQRTLVMATRRKHLILTPPVRAGKAIKVRLDARTVVMVKNAKALAFWKERYPKAEVIKD